MSGFSQIEFEKRLMTLKGTSECIQSLSLWCIKHRHQHKRIVNCWFKILKRCKIQQRLTLFYFANEIIQFSKRKKMEFVASFKLILESSMPFVRDESMRPSILRLLGIWKEREIYPEPFIIILKNIVTNIDNATSEENAKLLSDFRTSDLIEFIEKVDASSTVTIDRRQCLNETDFDISSFNILDIVHSVKSRPESSSFIETLDTGITSIENYVQALSAEIQLRSDLIEKLEHGEIFYDAQAKDASVVALAYKNFAKGIREIKKKLDNKLEALGEVDLPFDSVNFQSIVDSAPSPTSDDDLLLLDKFGSSAVDTRSNRNCGSSNDELIHRLIDNSVSSLDNRLESANYSTLSAQNGDKDQGNFVQSDEVFTDSRFNIHKLIGGIMNNSMENADTSAFQASISRDISSSRMNEEFHTNFTDVKPVIGTEDNNDDEVYCFGQDIGSGSSFRNSISCEYEDDDEQESHIEDFVSRFNQHAPDNMSAASSSMLFDTGPSPFTCSPAHSGLMGSLCSAIPGLDFRSKSSATPVSGPSEVIVIGDDQLTGSNDQFRPSVSVSRWETANGVEYVPENFGQVGGATAVTMTTHVAPETEVSEVYSPSDAICDIVAANEPLAPCQGRQFPLFSAPSPVNSDMSLSAEESASNVSRHRAQTPHELASNTVTVSHDSAKYHVPASAHHTARGHPYHPSPEPYEPQHVHVPNHSEEHACDNNTSQISDTKHQPVGVQYIPALGVFMHIKSETCTSTNAPTEREMERPRPLNPLSYELDPQSVGTDEPQVVGFGSSRVPNPVIDVIQIADELDCDKRRDGSRGHSEDSWRSSHRHSRRRRSTSSSASTTYRRSRHRRHKSTSGHRRRRTEHGSRRRKSRHRSSRGSERESKSRHRRSRYRRSHSREAKTSSRHHSHKHASRSYNSKNHR